MITSFSSNQPPIANFSCDASLPSATYTANLTVTDSGGLPTWVQLPCAGSASGNQKCEFACEAEALCDEKSVGDTCGTNKVCDNSCACIATYTLSVFKSGHGSGTVTSSPAGINCGTDCTETYNSGTSVTLTATAAADSTFAGWSGGGCSGTSTCALTMDAAKTVTATFDISICSDSCVGYQLKDYGQDCSYNSGPCLDFATRYVGGVCDVCPLNNNSCSSKYSTTSQTTGDCVVPENMWLDGTFTVAHTVTLLGTATLMVKDRAIVGNGKIIIPTGATVYVGSGGGGGSCQDPVSGTGNCGTANTNFQATWGGQTDNASKICATENRSLTPSEYSLNDACVYGTGPDYSVGLFQLNLYRTGRCPGAFQDDGANHCIVISQSTLDQCKTDYGYGNAPLNYTRAKEIYDAAGGWCPWTTSFPQYCALCP